MALGKIDRSGSIAAGGVSQQVMAANTARKKLVFQNISDTAMYINFGANAVVDSNSYKILPDCCWSEEAPGSVHTQAVNVICSVIAKKFVAEEA